jgi:peptidoglycan/LPS O-acetylase OafA/YrhL
MLGRFPFRHVEIDGSRTEEISCAAQDNSPHVAKSRSYVPTLDGWRALSVLAIILYHGSPKDESSWIQQGQKGVLVFFVISGYLITLKLLEAPGAPETLDFKGFYLRRALRILPAALLCLAGLALLSWWSVIPPLCTEEVLGSLMFVRNVFPVIPDRDMWYTAHFWSLAVEEQFYLFWPLILFVARRRARATCLGLVGAIGIWRALANHWPQPRLGVPVPLANSAFDFILWGCWWALVLRSETARSRARRFLSVPVWVCLAVFAASAVFWQVPGVTSLLAALIPLLIVGTVLRPESPVGAVLEWPGLRWIGRLSYGLYLWQQLFFVAYSAHAPMWFQVFPWNALLLFGVATLSYYAVERPLVGLGQRLTQGREPAHLAKSTA